MKRRLEHVKELKEEARGWTLAEAAAKEREYLEQLFRLKFQFASGQTDALQKIRERRKDIARIKTILLERQLGAESTKKA
jgi:large subunit ribosomal protein L29